MARASCVLAIYAIALADAVLLAPLSPRRVVEAAGLPGIDTAGPTYAAGPFTCDALMAKKCAGAGPPSLAAALCDVRPVAHPAGDGFTRSTRFYSCLLAPATQGDGALCDAGTRAPIVCLQSEAEVGTGGADGSVSVGVGGLDAARLASGVGGRGRGRGSVSCTCWARVDTMGMTARGPGAGGRTISDAFPLEAAAAGGNPSTPHVYSGRPSDYFPRDGSDPGPLVEP
jgi:hypothetical protein